jgi:molybdopterin-guanine dinucleotide biosynthesis protein A
VERRRAAGIMLAGGLSSRMGRDKATLKIGESTTTGRVIDALALISDEVIVASGARPLNLGRERRVTQVPDPAGFSGPLAGLVAGMRATHTDRFVVVACDMPFVNPALLQHLLDSVNGCAAAVPEFGGRPQPLQAAYSRACLAPAESLLRLGRNSMAALLGLVAVRYIGAHECARLDPSGLSGFNINRPEDLVRAQELLATAPPLVIA